LLLIIAPGSGPQLDATVDFFGRTCSDKYARASLASHLDAGSTDTAGCGMDQDCLAFLQAAESKQGLLRSKKYLWHSCSWSEFPLCWYGHRPPGANHSLPSLPAAADQAEHTIAGSDIFHCRSYGLNLAG